MKLYHALSAMLIATVFSIQAVASPMLHTNKEEILKELDNALRKRPQYKGYQKTRIDSLKASLNLTPDNDRGDLFMRIAEEFAVINYDSTRHYYQMAADTYMNKGDIENSALANANTGATLTMLGAIPEGLKLYISSEKTLKSPKIKLGYYTSGLMMYDVLADLYPIGDNMHNEYKRRMLAASDSILALTDDKDAIAHFAHALQYESQGKQSLMVAELNDAINYSGPDSILYGQVVNKLADYYASHSRNDEAIYYYAQAAINALKSCDFAAHALHQLGLLLNQDGDHDRSFDYLTASFRESVSSDHRLRAMRVADAFPIIDMAYRQRHTTTVNLLWLAIAVISVMLIAIIILLRKNRRVSQKEQRLLLELDKANAQKVNNVSHFLSLSSMFIEKFDEFSRTARRKIKTGQLDDLYSMINSAKLSDQFTHEFLAIFDKSFLHIFPTFVSDVNMMLKEECRFDLSEGETGLTTELRILAFLRLGIDESNRIAKFMGLSINTIYTYRNKMRGRAIDRETFEESLLKIKAR